MKMYSVGAGACQWVFHIVWYKVFFFIDFYSSVQKIQVCLTKFVFEFNCWMNIIKLNVGNNLINSCNLSLPWVKIMNISSMNLSHNSGFKGSCFESVHKYVCIIWGSSSQPGCATHL